MLIGIYPGSFAPFHEGHLDIVKKALPMCKELRICIGRNPDKTSNHDLSLLHKFKEVTPYYGTPVNKGSDKIVIHMYDGLLKDYLIKQPADVIIKGLRNGQDLEYERSQQYWNEDLGVKIPTAFFICDRSLIHISSSAIRLVKTFKEG